MINVRVRGHLPQQHDAFLSIVILACLVIVLPNHALAQTESATLSGTIVDQSGALVPDVRVTVTSEDTGISVERMTNRAGVYSAPALKPGRYRMAVSKEGFKQVVLRDLVLNVQDVVSRNFSLQVGGTSETVQVQADAATINTTDATVSTVVDRNFAENLPMNGRSFQTLIQLTPGVVLTASTNTENGQFSVNGQRTASNYWTVDGVSANVGISTTNQTGNGISGAQASFSVLGGTNSLVSVDAMQEFRIQTSTYAPEFGRTPGGQISIATRSGTNQLHGAIFEYLRNDLFDANDWFANHTKQPKPKERQNDFGGTLGGPIIKDRTFFFFSYEGLRLRLPQVALETVPDLLARQQAVPSMQPFLNSYPLPNGQDNVATGIAQFNASYSNSATLNAYSLRVDQRLGNKFTVFGRYSDSPSSLVQRGGTARVLSAVVPAQNTLQTATIGTTWTVSPAMLDDLRINYSKTNASSFSYSDNFGGAVPLTNLPLPSGFNAHNGAFQFFLLGVTSLGPNLGLQGQNKQRQVNVVDSLSVQKGSHTLKFGIDYRRLSPVYGNPAYDYEVIFSNVAKAVAGTPALNIVSSTSTGAFLFHNIGLFAQDTWRVVPRLTLTYGLRWDVDVAPSSTPSLAALTGFSPGNLSTIALAPAGTPPFKTPYGNVAPRLGVAYQVRQSQNWQTVIRAGVGAFFDLASSEAGNIVYYTSYPFGSVKLTSGGSFPVSGPAATPASLTDGLTSGSGVFAFDPNLKLPYTLEWNAAIEQALGVHQSISLSYLGSAGRRLIRTTQVVAPNSSFADATLITNAGSSDYDALQIQFQRRLSNGLQVLASYSWSHSIDDASVGDVYGSSLLSGASNSTRGPSDFDIRHSFSAGVTYDIQVPRFNAVTNAILQHWSTDNFVIARSAPPVTVTDGFVHIVNNIAQPRADLVSGQPLYLYGTQYPGGKAFNPAAFVAPPADSAGHLLRQGTTARNFLRGFGAAQWDLAVHREFPILESVKLQFRAEMFNVLNHAVFAPPVSDITQGSQFGQSIQTLGNYLTGGSVGRGSLSSLYQIGGPRSIQFALKLMF